MIDFNKIPEVDRRNLTLIYEEYLAAKKQYPAFNSPHEAYAVILEELDEVWKIIKSSVSRKGNIEAMKYEVKAVGAMALRFMNDL